MQLVDGDFLKVICNRVVSDWVCVGVGHVVGNCAGCCVGVCVWNLLVVNNLLGMVWE